MTCPSCHSENCELLSVLHAHRRAAAPHASPPQPAQGAHRLGLAALILMVPALLHSGWWMAGAAVLGLASVTARATERRHHARALAEWSRSCLCLDCGAGWQRDVLDSEIRFPQGRHARAEPDSSLQHL